MAISGVKSTGHFSIIKSIIHIMQSGLRHPTQPMNARKLQTGDSTASRSAGYVGSLSFLMLTPAIERDSTQYADHHSLNGIKPDWVLIGSQMKTTDITSSMVTQ